MLGVVGFAIAANVAANAFFNRLVSSHPDLAGAFPAPGLFSQTPYGPIRPSYMAYLKAGKHLELPEANLQAQGAKVLKLVSLFVTCFAVLIWSGLWWGYQNAA